MDPISAIVVITFASVAVREQLVTQEFFTRHLERWESSQGWSRKLADAVNCFFCSVFWLAIGVTAAWLFVPFAVIVITAVAAAYIAYSVKTIIDGLHAKLEQHDAGRTDVQPKDLPTAPQE